MSEKRDHGGGIDAAIAQYGGTRKTWLDLSTGINPVPYPVGDIDAEAWTALPDQSAMDSLLSAARDFWNVPEGAKIIAAPGASALIARLPHVLGGTRSAMIAEPTYNEWNAAFAGAGWDVGFADPGRSAEIWVHPNNPDGVLASVLPRDLTDPRTANLRSVYDESFCDPVPELSTVGLTGQDPQHLVLKSFGKFWGLAGLRLGFLIGSPDYLTPMAEALGPWPVAGPALEIGTRALADTAWANATRSRLEKDAKRLDAMMLQTTGREALGTTLFRTYFMKSQAERTALHEHLAKAHILTRIFDIPGFSNTRRWIRFGLPAPDGWDRLEAALSTWR